MAERPHVGGNGVQVGPRKVYAAHRRHRAGMSLGLRHAILDRRLETLQASIAPEPPPARQIWSDGRSFAICTMAAAAGAVRYLSVEKAVSEQDLLFRKAPRRQVVRPCPDLAVPISNCISKAGG
jgi:hypothetical protein